MLVGHDRVGLLVLHPRNLLCNAPHGLPGLLPHPVGLHHCSWTPSPLMRTFPTEKKTFLTLLFVLRWHTAALPRPRSCSFSIFFFRFRGGRGSSTAMRGVLILRVKTLASYVARPFILRGSSPTRVYRLSRNAVKPPREREKRGLAKHAPEQRKRHRAPRPPQLHLKS